jgi:hypothetical protein
LNFKRVTGKSQNRIILQQEQNFMSLKKQNKKISTTNNKIINGRKLNNYSYFRKRIVNVIKADEA